MTKAEIAAIPPEVIEGKIAFIEERRQRQIISRDTALKLKNKMPTSGDDAVFEDFYRKCRSELRPTWGGTGPSSRAYAYAKRLSAGLPPKQRAEVFLDVVVAFDEATLRVLDTVLPFTRAPQG
jgi:hypothetical protein